MSFAVLAPGVGAVTILFALCEYCSPELAMSTLMANLILCAVCKDEGPEVQWGQV